MNSGQAHKARFFFRSVLEIFLRALPPQLNSVERALAYRAGGRGFKPSRTTPTRVFNVLIYNVKRSAKAIVLSLMTFHLIFKGVPLPGLIGIICKPNRHQHDGTCTFEVEQKGSLRL